MTTNCLAALGNMAPCYKKLHPHAARCLVSLCDALSRKYAKLCRHHHRGLENQALSNAKAQSEAQGFDAEREGDMLCEGTDEIQARDPPHFGSISLQSAITPADWLSPSVDDVLL